MTDTSMHNGTHDAQEHNESDVDTFGADDELKQAADNARRRSVKLTAKRDQLNAEIKRLQDDRAQLNAELERCHSIITWSTKQVKARGRKSSTAPAKGKNR